MLPSSCMTVCVLHPKWNEHVNPESFSTGLHGNGTGTQWLYRKSQVQSSAVVSEELGENKSLRGKAIHGLKWFVICINSQHKRDFMFISDEKNQ